MHSPEPQQPPRSRRGFLALLLLVAVVTPIVILIASNTDSGAIAWAGWEWEAPRWLVLTVTFVAGIVGGKLFGWLWRSWRRRRRRLADQRDVARRVAAGQGG
jgi:uncharacterized integral membrane protein